MTTQDITRYLFQPKKHYVGSQLQQGRILLDSDFNEDAWATDEDQRRVLKDIVGPAGSPDGGFSLDVEIGREIGVVGVYFNDPTQPPPIPPPANPPDGVLVYPIKPGSLYLCGLRFELEPRTTKDFCDPNADVEVGDWQVFQRDHLEITYDEAPKPQEGVTHAQLAYVEGWEQTVSAVEDDEVLEKALGGVDTSVRVRRMARVHVADVNLADTCSSAWTTVQGQIETDRGGTFAADGCEFNSGARLQITFPSSLDDPNLDACSPCVPGDVGRYLGAENQAIRIMLVDTDKYVFGVNNAAPIFRVQVGPEAGGKLPVVMQTPPRDEFQWPLRNTVVELIGWSAVLPNGEKVAAEIGKFFIVTDSFDPATSTFYLDATAESDIQSIIQDWDDRHPDHPQLPNEADPSLRYLFMRIWHQVDEGTTEPLLTRNVDNTLIQRLGISPTFGGVGSPGEYWVVSARPDTPQQIVPWDLTQLGGVPPHGPRHFFAPMTLVHMRPPGPGEHPDCEVVDHVEACLEPMRSLTQLTTGCCTLTVGDGVTTTGDFSSIQEAIDALPSDGGKICILPGVYTENVVLTNPDVTLEGCGRHTILRTPGAESDGTAVIQILAERTTVKSLTIESRGQIGILVGEEDPTVLPYVAKSVVLEELDIAAERIDLDRRARSPIDVRGGEHVEIRDCDLSMTGFLTDDAVVYLHGDDLLLFDCRVSVFDITPEDVALGAWGGVQVAGGSTDVELRQNTISAGFGHGITLGSLKWIPQAGGPTESGGASEGFREIQNGCSVHNPQPPETLERRGLVFNYETMGEINDLRIVDNRIENMLANGISVLTLNRLINANEDTELIAVNDLTIEGNQIVDNIRDFSVLLNATAATKLSAKAKGGQDEALGQLLLPADLPAAAILLAEGENITIRNNVVRGNGAGDPGPVCGICVAFGNGVVIEGNRVQNNGLKLPGRRGDRGGAAAGIFVFLAGVSAAPDDFSGDVADLHGTSLRVVSNVVQQRAGLALFARATGPIVVDGNYLESQGNNEPTQAANQAYTVQVLNNGLPWEAIDVPAGEPSESTWDLDPARAALLADAWGVDGGTEVNPYGMGGRIAFTNNHVTLPFVTDPVTGATPGVAQGFSVSLGSLDDVIMTGNQLGMNIENPSSKKKKSKVGIGTTFNTPPMSAQAIIVAQTATVSNNRVAEGVVDSQISLITIGGLSASSTGNITTHRQYVANCASAPADGDITGDPVLDEHVIDAHNLVLLDGGPSDFPFGKFWTNAVANTLIQGLCAFWLELEPSMEL